MSMNIQVSSCGGKVAIPFFGDESQATGSSPVYKGEFINQVQIIIPASTHQLQTVRGVTITDVLGEVMNATVQITPGTYAVTITFAAQQSGSYIIF